MKGILSLTKTSIYTLAHYYTPKQLKYLILLENIDNSERTSDKIYNA